MEDLSQPDEGVAVDGAAVTLLRLPMFPSVADALAYCAAHSLHSPALHEGPDGSVRGSAWVADRPMDHVKHEAGLVLGRAVELERTAKEMRP